MLAASRPALPVVEYTPAEIKRAVVGYGRAEKPQVQQMVKLLLGLDARRAARRADALAVAICHLHSGRRTSPSARAAQPPGARAGRPRRGARYRPSGHDRASSGGRSLEKHPNRVIVDVAGVGYDVQVPLSTFYVLGEPAREIAARPHPRARGSARALRVRDRARAGAVRAADRDQRHRTEAGARGAVGHRARASWSARSSAATSRG